MSPCRSEHPTVTAQNSEEGPHAAAHKSEQPVGTGSGGSERRHACDTVAHAQKGYTLRADEAGHSGSPCDAHAFH